MERSTLQLITALDMGRTENNHFLMYVNIRITPLVYL